MKSPVIKITKSDDGYFAALGDGHPHPFTMRAEDPIEVRGATSGSDTVETILKNLQALGANTGYSQLNFGQAHALGRYLGRLIWGDSDTGQGGVLPLHYAETLEHLVIETDDAFLAGVPWALTRMPGGLPMIQQRIATSLRAPNARLGPKTFGLSPEGSKILVVCPDPYRDVSAYQARNQFDLCNRLAGRSSEPQEVLRELATAFETAWQKVADVPTGYPANTADLSDMWKSLSKWRKARCPDTDPLSNSLSLPPVRTWEELQARLQSDLPEIIYYMGHGDALDGNALKLKFEGAGGSEAPVDAQTVADHITGHSALHQKIQLFYLNCCWGGAALERGGLMQLGSVLPAYISNRLPAVVPIAQAQAIDTLEEIIHRDVPPHEAVTNVQLRARSTRGGHTGAGAVQDEPWWLGPVMAINYRNWTPRQNENMSDVSRHGLTKTQTLRLNRNDHVDAMNGSIVRVRSARDAPNALLVVWAGSKRDGVSTLGDRLWSELADEQGSDLRRLSRFNIGWDKLFEDNVDQRKILADLLGGTFLRASDDALYDYNDSDPEREEASLTELCQRVSQTASRGGGLILARHEAMQPPIYPQNAPDVEAAAQALFEYASLCADLGEKLADESTTLVVFAPVEDVEIEKLRKALNSKIRGRHIVVLPELARLTLQELRTFIDGFGFSLNERRAYSWEQIDTLPQHLLETCKGVMEDTRDLLHDAPKDWLSRKGTRKNV